MTESSPKQIGETILQGLLGTWMSMGSSVAFLLNHLGDALIGIYIAPLFTIILSSIFLKVIS